MKWPNSHEFAESLRDRSLYGSKVTRYILTEFNRHLPGDAVNITGVEIEHILPQTMSTSWKELFSESDHRQHVDRLANLTLLTEPMNQAVSNGGYGNKRAVYRDSKYAMTRQIAATYEEWTIEQINIRAEELVTWALARWPEE